MALEVPPTGRPPSDAAQIANVGASTAGLADATLSPPTTQAGDTAPANKTATGNTAAAEAKKADAGCGCPKVAPKHIPTHHVVHHHQRVHPSEHPKSLAPLPPAKYIPSRHEYQLPPQAVIPPVAQPQEYAYPPPPPTPVAPSFGGYYPPPEQTYYPPPQPMMPWGGLGLAIGGVFGGRFGWGGFHGWGGGWGRHGGIGLQIGLFMPMPFYPQPAFYTPPQQAFYPQRPGYGYAGLPPSQPQFAPAAYEPPYAYGGSYAYGGAPMLPLVASAGFRVGGRRGGFIVYSL